MKRISINTNRHNITKHSKENLLESFHTFISTAINTNSKHIINITILNDFPLFQNIHLYKKE